MPLREPRWDVARLGEGPAYRTLLSDLYWPLGSPTYASGRGEHLRQNRLAIRALSGITKRAGWCIVPLEC
jgi:hypothetical protein